MLQAINAMEHVNLLDGLQKCLVFPKLHTLHDYISGKVEFGARSGPKMYLTSEEEELVTFLVESAKIGHPHTKKLVLGIVQ